MRHVSHHPFAFASSLNNHHEQCRPDYDTARRIKKGFDGMMFDCGRVRCQSVLTSGPITIGCIFQPSTTEFADLVTLLGHTTLVSRKGVVKRCPTQPSIGFCTSRPILVDVMAAAAATTRRLINGDVRGICIGSGYSYFSINHHQQASVCILYFHSGTTLPFVVTFLVLASSSVSIRLYHRREAAFPALEPSCSLLWDWTRMSAAI